MTTSKIAPSAPTTMKAIAFDSFGDENVLNVASLPRPTVEPAEVLIKLSHTSVNPVDWKIRRGYLTSMLPHIFPIIPGWDAAGVVEAIGSEVKNFKVGDRVAAYARLPEVHSGTYAEYISLPESFLAKLEGDLPFEQAAGVPLVSLTASQGLTDYAKINAGDRVLVLNGAGGVGNFAVQFAKQLGAVVTATTSTRNIEYVKSFGADHVIDYTKESLEVSARAITPGGFDFVFDAIGGESLTAALKLVKRGGQVVSIVDSPDQALAEAKGIKAVFHFVHPDGTALQNIFANISTGKTKVPSYSVLPVTQARNAHISSESHRTRGKIVLKISFDQKPTQPKTMDLCYT
jgi:NADPH:quinone reductase-like Zn-dependent oxidoreductase